MTIFPYFKKEHPEQNQIYYNYLNKLETANIPMFL
jgi:hypothetical protein